MHCPYCFEKIEAKLVKKDNYEVYECPKCKNSLNRNYVENNIPRKNIGLVGFTGHGKTCYISSLFFVLRKIGNKHICWESLDEDTIKEIYENKVDKLAEGKVPGATRVVLGRPLVTKFKIHKFGEFILNFYDAAGESFNKIEHLVNSARFVALSDVNFFVIDSEKIIQSNQDPTSLLERYVNGASNNLHQNLKSKNLIVVLTKADTVLNELPKNLKDFLLNGNYKWYNSDKWGDENYLKSKIKEIKEKSNEIKKFINSKIGTRFTSYAEEKFNIVYYTLVSSLGAGNISGGLDIKDPKRVLDPLILAIDSTINISIYNKISPIIISIYNKISPIIISIYNKICR